MDFDNKDIVTVVLDKELEFNRNCELKNLSK